jgi:uncharacterized protein
MTALHLFRQCGEHFVFHAGMGRFVRITPEAYDYLELRGAMPPEEAARRFSADHPGAESVLADVAALEADGFFEPVETLMPDDAEFESALDERFSGPCNSIVLSVSTGCNLACRYCYCGICRDILPDKGMMPEDVALRAVDTLFAAADPKVNVRVTFFGGEPLLNKSVIRKVVAVCDAKADRLGVRTEYSITTNATLVDDETAEMLSAGNFGLMVSMDGPQDLHDSQCPTRDGHGSFELVAAGVRRIMAHRDKVTVRCTMAHPAPDAMRLIRFFADFGFSRVVLGTVRNPAFPSACDFTAEDSAAFDRAMEREIIPWMLEEHAAGRTPIYDPFDDISAFHGAAGNPSKAELRCGACHGSCAVAPDGTLYPCHRFVGMKAWALGDISEGFPDARGREFWRAWRAAVREKCSGCWALGVCGGPCPWEVARADGTFAPPDELLCEETRSWAQQGAYYFHKVGESDRNKGENKT